MNKQFIIFQLLSIIYLIEFGKVESHGFLSVPTGRGSRWRVNASAPTDYNDNEGFCGGFGVQYGKNGGKCGMCGDNYNDKVPRAHELGGLYGEGIIVAEYKSGTNMDIKVDITANHNGTFEFSICNLDKSKETQECFKPLELNDGGFKYEIKYYKPALFKVPVKIPAVLKCKHCVLKWTYICANSWGICQDGTGAIGCGQQENFVGCADIAIS